jgi:hypothetical protein
MRPEPVIPPRTLASLLVAALSLPIAITVLAGVARLLSAMGDAAGAAVVDRLALAGGIVWIVLLVCLVLMLGILALARPQEPPEE